MNIKKHLYNKCQEFVKNKLQTIENTIKSNQEGLRSETKSSAGDKHETGRAMLQLEMEKAGQQLHVVNQMQAVLKRIDISKSNKKICLGSYIETSENNYFLAISIGKIATDKGDCFVVSTFSPIGKQLLGKQQGDIIKWQKTPLLIHKVT